MINSLTGLRAIAAYWVVLLHTCFGKAHDFLPGFDKKVDWGPLENLISRGPYAVDLFFVLSGFIMCYVYKERFMEKGDFPRKFLTFLTLRLARIYPVYLFGTLLTILLFSEVGPLSHRNWTYYEIIMNVTLTNMWSLPSINTPAWSVSAEWFAYLSFPVVLVFLRFLKQSKICILWLIFLSLSYGLYLEIFTAYMDWHWGFSGLYRVITGFLSGAIVHFLYSQDTDNRSKGFYDIAFYMVTIVFCFLIMTVFTAVLVYPLIPFMILFLAKSRTFVKTMMGNKVMIYLGAISYSVYIMHYPILEIFDYIFADYYKSIETDYTQLSVWAHLALILSTVTIVSALTYHLIEEPCRQYIKKRISF